MKEPHLLRVLRSPEDYTALTAALKRRGERFGWLDLRSPPEPPQRLAAAAELGALRVVGIGEGWSVAVKPMRGEPVLRDVVREHFRGCRVVFVEGQVALPIVEPAEDDRWTITPEEGRILTLTLAEWADRLRRPRPWD